MFYAYQIKSLFIHQSIYCKKSLSLSLSIYIYIYIYIYIEYRYIFLLNTLSGGKSCLVAPGVAVPPWATETVLSPWLAADEDRVSHVLSHVVWWKKNVRVIIKSWNYDFRLFNVSLQLIGWFYYLFFLDFVSIFKNFFSSFHVFSGSWH